MAEENILINLVKDLILEVLLEGKFSPEVEKIIKTDLKKRYGDPYKIKNKKKRKAVAAKVFGTAMKIEKSIEKRKKKK